MATKPINVVIKGDYTDKDINRAIRDLERLKTQSATTTGTLGKLQKNFTDFAPGLIAGLGVMEFVNALKSAGQAAMDDEVKMASLAKTLDNVGQGFRSTDVEQFIGQMQLASGVADNDLRVAFQKLVTVTGDVQRSQEALRLAMDISAGTGKDLDAVSLALAKAYGGQTTALQRLGVGLDAALLKSKDMGAITDALSSKFSGQAAVAAETYQGQMNRLTQAVGEAQEAIGYALLRAMDDLIGKMGGTGGLQQSIIDAGDSIADMIDNISLTVTQVDRLGRSFVTLTTGGLVQVDENVSLVDQGFQALIDSVTSLLAGPLVNLVAFLEDLGWVSGDASSATSDLALEHEHMARASNSAADGLAGLTDETEAAGDAAWYATKSYLALYESIAQGERAQRDFANTSGTVSSAIAAGARTGGVAEYWENLRQKYGEVEQAAKSAGSVGGAAAEELAIKWKQAAASVTADVEGLKVSMGGGGQVIAGALVDQFQSRLGAFKAVVDAQVGIIRQAQDAINSYSKSVVDSILGGISISTTDAQGNALTPDQIVTALFGGIENRTKAVEAIAAIATKIPAALAQQLITLTATDPQGAIALANYLANNPAQLEQLTLNYNALSEFTKVALGDPMGIAFAQIGDESATKMIEDAKKKIADSATEFQAWVRSKLKTRITVEVEYVAVNVVPGARLEARADGGPVNGNQAYVVGEQGPEIFLPNRSGVIIPNSDLGGGGSAISGGNTYNINVSTGVGDPRQIGEQVVSYIKRFEAASGPVFARA